MGGTTCRRRELGRQCLNFTDLAAEFAAGRVSSCVGVLRAGGASLLEGLYQASPGFLPDRRSGRRRRRASAWRFARSTRKPATVSASSWSTTKRASPSRPHDKGRGYEYAKGSYLMIEDDELDAIEIESNRTIEIDTFVPRAEIDERFLDSPYYIAPNEPVGQEAFAVIREAMRGKDMVALGRVVLSKRERVIMLQPWDNGLLGTTLRYPYELREAKDYFYDIADVKVEPELLTLAQHILKTKEARFDPTQVRGPLRAGRASKCCRRSRPGCRRR